MRRTAVQNDRVLPQKSMRKAVSLQSPPADYAVNGGFIRRHEQFLLTTTHLYEEKE